MQFVYCLWSWDHAALLSAPIVHSELRWVSVIRESLLSTPDCCCINSHHGVIKALKHKTQVFGLNNWHSCECCWVQQQQQLQPLFRPAEVLGVGIQLHDKCFKIPTSNIVKMLTVDSCVWPDVAVSTRLVQVSEELSASQCRSTC